MRSFKFLNSKIKNQNKSSHTILAEHHATKSCPFTTPFHKNRYHNAHSNPDKISLAPPSFRVSHSDISHQIALSFFTIIKVQGISLLRALLSLHIGSVKPSPPCHEGIWIIHIEESLCAHKFQRRAHTLSSTKDSIVENEPSILFSTQCTPCPLTRLFPL